MLKREAYIQNLTGIEFTEALYLTDFLDGFPEISVTTHEWDSGGPMSGNYSYITVHRKSQARLLRKLTVIRDRLKMFGEGGSFAREIEAKLEATEN